MRNWKHRRTRGRNKNDDLLSEIFRTLDAMGEIVRRFLVRFAMAFVAGVLAFCLVFAGGSIAVQTLVQGFACSLPNHNTSTQSATISPAVPRSSDYSPTEWHPSRKAADIISLRAPRGDLSKWPK